MPEWNLAAVTPYKPIARAFLKYVALEKYRLTSREVPYDLFTLRYLKGFERERDCGFDKVVPSEVPLCKVIASTLQKWNFFVISNTILLILSKSCDPEHFCAKILQIYVWKGLSFVGQTVGFSKNVH